VSSCGSSLGSAGENPIRNNIMAGVVLINLGQCPLGYPHWH
jgi:hypothetical protein